MAIAFRQVKVWFQNRRMKDKRQRLQPINKSKDDEVEGSEGEMESSDDMKESNDQKESNSEKDAEEENIYDQEKKAEKSNEKMQLDNFTDRQSENDTKHELSEETKVSVDETETLEPADKLFQTSLPSKTTPIGYYDNSKNEAKENLSSTDDNLQPSLFSIPTTAGSTVSHPDVQTIRYKNSNNNHLPKHAFAYAENSVLPMFPLKEKPHVNAVVGEEHEYGYDAQSKSFKSDTSPNKQSPGEAAVKEHVTTAHLLHEQHYNYVEASTEQGFGVNSSNASAMNPQSSLLSNRSSLKVTNSVDYQNSRAESFALNSHMPRSNSNGAIYEGNKLPSYPSLATKQTVYRQASLQQQPQAFTTNMEMRYSQNSQMGFQNKNIDSSAGQQHYHPDFNRFNSYPSYTRPLPSNSYSNAKQTPVHSDAFRSTRNYNNTGVNQQISLPTSKYGFAEGQATVGYLPAPSTYQQRSTASLALKREQSASIEMFSSKQEFLSSLSTSRSQLSKPCSNFNLPMDERQRDKSSRDSPTEDHRSALYVQPITPPTEPGPTVFTQTHTPIADKEMLSNFVVKIPANQMPTYSVSSAATSSTQTSGLLNDVQKILDPNVLHL